MTGGSTDNAGNASSLSAIVNTVNTIIGAGVLVLPYAFRTDSILLGSLIIILAGLLNCIGMILQGAASKFLPNGKATFFTVCKLTYPKLSVLFDFAIFLQCFGVNISYLVLTGDILPLVYAFDGWDGHSMKVFYIVSSLILIVPLCLLKKIDSLKYASVVALSAIVYICLLIYGHFFLTLIDPTDHEIGEISIIKPEGIKPIFKTLGIVVLAYTCPTQFSIIAELKNPTMKRISNIAYISMSITAFIFLTVAFAGYLTYGNLLNGNILLMYENNIFTTTGRGLLILMVILSYPLMFHPARVSFNNVYHVISHLYGTSRINENTPLLNDHEFTEAEEDHVDVPMSNTRFYVISAILLIGSYSSALLLNSFEVILSIVGSTGGVLISFILPGFYGYKLISTQDESLTNKLVKYSPLESGNPIFYSKWLKKVSLFLIIWGFLVMIICLYSTIFD